MKPQRNCTLGILSFPEITFSMFRILYALAILLSCITTTRAQTSVEANPKETALSTEALAEIGSFQIQIQNLKQVEFYPSEEMLRAIESERSERQSELKEIFGWQVLILSARAHQAGERLPLYSLVPQEE